MDQTSAQPTEAVDLPVGADQAGCELTRAALQLGADEEALASAEGHRDSCHACQAFFSISARHASSYR